MRQQDRAAFVELLAGVFSIYRQDVSEFALGVWWNTCARYDFDQVRAAFNAHVMDPEHGQYPPKPADIVRQLQGTHGDRALIAWGKAYEAMSTVGSYESVVFDDGVIHAVIADLGGWPAFCSTKDDELPFVQRRFCDAYRAYSRRPETSFPPRLIGREEAENGEQFKQHVKPPILIGDASRAQQVAQLGASCSKAPFTRLGAALPASIKQLTEGGKEA